MEGDHPTRGETPCRPRSAPTSSANPAAPSSSPTGIELSDPQPGEVVVRYTSTGLCHTDLFGRDVFHEDDFPPTIYGHEGTGVVEAVGAGVTEFAEGDRVMASFTSCGKCRTCLTGRPFNCELFNDINFALTRGDGSHKARTRSSRSRTPRRAERPTPSTPPASHP